MTGESRPATLNVVADKGTALSKDAVSLGLIVTELVINALKYAFPDRKKAATVLVKYEANNSNWRITVSDNGVGRKKKNGTDAESGLDNSIVNALANQLNAQVKTVSNSIGMSVSVTHATFTPRPGPQLSSSPPGAQLAL